MSWYGENGLKVYCDNGLLAENDECPCGCPSFVGRTIAYVDKNVVGGLGDGSTWANAYTDIQTAIDANPKKEIDIQGYGESDTYPAGIVLSDCNYLKGIGDVWLDGNGISTGINGNDITTTKIKTINIKNCNLGFSGLRGGGIVENCLIKECVIGFYLFSGAILINCIADSCLRVGYGILDNCTLTNCIGRNTTIDSSGLFYSGSAVYKCTICIFNNFIASDNGSYGIVRSTSSVFDTCSATGNGQCGYFRNYSAIYISCVDLGNCLDNGGDCTPYNCDTV